MDYQLSCTTEELAVLLSVSGYTEFAKGIAVTSFGDRTEKDWKLVAEVTVPHLILKQIWDEKKDAKGELPLSENMQKFIKSYVESKRLIRCSDAPNISSFMFHKVDERGWLAHSIYRDIIHEFSYVEAHEIPNIVNNYYNFEFFEKFSSNKFNLSDEDFDSLKNPENAKRILAKVSSSERESFEKFLSDLKVNNWSLFNISNFSLSDREEDTYLENIVFFLPSTNGVWVVEYTDDPVSPVSILLNPSDEWYQVINGVGFVAAASS